MPPSCRRRIAILPLALLALCAAPVALPAASAADTTGTAAKLGSRPLRTGAAGADVQALQRLLAKVGIKVSTDGHFGATTAKAVQRFQRAAGLEPSGTVGKVTLQTLRRAAKGGAANVSVGGYDDVNGEGAHHSLGDRIPVRSGMSGHDVKVLQDFLRRAGVKNVTIDGEFGTGTRRAVQSFERQNNLPVNGNVDANDIAALRQLAGARPRAASDAPLKLAPGDRAKIGSDGLAIAPASAPDAVKQIIAAGNKIAKTPYVYGGGHGKWEDRGYDCSGSVSYALHGAGLLDQAKASGDFMGWGAAGPGQWVTIYANGGHAYMVVAGIRFDTSGRSQAGTRWQADNRSSSGYSVRHPEGL